MTLRILPNFGGFARFPVSPRIPEQTDATKDHHLANAETYKPIGGVAMKRFSTAVLIGLLSLTMLTTAAVNLEEREHAVVVLTG